MNKQKNCPVCGVDLATVDTGIYGHNNILKEMCLSCAEKLKKDMTNKLILYMLIGGAIGIGLFLFIF